jgi:gluconolactonase
MKYFPIFLLLSALACGTQPNNAADDSDKASVRNVERIAAGLDEFIAPGAEIEVLDSGYTWTEGPVWSKTLEGLLYCDIPANRIYLWTEKEGSRVYLDSSGYTQETPRGGELGSNGLWIDNYDRLILCQHGNRAVAVMEANLGEPNASFTNLADNYEGKRLNSPNDLVLDQHGNIYFTDPPYGLEGNVDDPLKEIDFQGVYRLDSSGSLTLITSEMTRPNGVGLSPDESVLYVANSDPSSPVWRMFRVEEDGIMDNGIFLDTSDKAGPGNPGLPDGLKVHSSGVIFATGPGGVWVITPESEVLGIIHTGVPTANCAFNEDESMLYMTADDYLMRIPLISP